MYTASASLCLVDLIDFSPTTIRLASVYLNPRTVLDSSVEWRNIRLNEQTSVNKLAICWIKRPALNFLLSIPRIFTRKLSAYLFLHTLLGTAKTDTLKPSSFQDTIRRRSLNVLNGKWEVSENKTTRANKPWFNFKGHESVRSVRLGRKRSSGCWSYHWLFD